MSGRPRPSRGRPRADPARPGRPRAGKRRSSGARRTRGSAAARAARPAGSRARSRAPRRRTPRVARDHARDRVVAAIRDRAVVRPGTRPRCRARRRNASSSSYAIGSSRPVARRHHERARGRGEQQVVQRRVRQHQPDERAVRSDAVREPARERDAATRTIGRSTDVSSSRSASRERRANRSAASRLAHHHGERLLVAPLARAQACDGAPPTSRRTRGDSRRAPSQRRCRRRAAPPRACAIGSPSSAVPRRSTTRRRGPQAEHAFGSRVEAAIARVLVLAAARRAHAERRHGRARPVVGHVERDRVARPTVRAVDERVPMPAVESRAQLAQALRARREVWRDRRRALRAAAAGDDLERADVLARNRAAAQAAHGRRGHRWARQTSHELPQRRVLAEGFDRDSARVVPDAPADRGRAGERVHPGAEPYALHEPVDLDPDATLGHLPLLVKHPCRSGSRCCPRFTACRARRRPRLRDRAHASSAAQDVPVIRRSAYAAQFDARLTAACSSADRSPGCACQRGPSYAAVRSDASRLVVMMSSPAGGATSIEAEEGASRGSLRQIERAQQPSAVDRARRPVRPGGARHGSLAARRARVRRGADRERLGDDAASAARAADRGSSSPSRSPPESRTR